MENIIVKYLEFVLACYVVRFLATRFVLEFQSVKKFYYRSKFFINITFINIFIHYILPPTFILGSKNP